MWDLGRGDLGRWNLEMWNLGMGNLGMGNLENLRFSYICGGCRRLGCGFVEMNKFIMLFLFFVG